MILAEQKGIHKSFREHQKELCYVESLKSSVGSRNISNQEQSADPMSLIIWQIVKLGSEMRMHQIGEIL